MPSFSFAPRFARVCFALLTLAIAGCATPKNLSFEAYGRGKQPDGTIDPSSGPVRSDMLAVMYAEWVAAEFRSCGTRVRVTREGSDTALLTAGIVAGAQETLGIASSTVAHVGLAAVFIKELQGIFNARGRSEAFVDAANLIDLAVDEYRTITPNPPPDKMTQNGATLVARVNACRRVVDKTLGGRLPDTLEMIRANTPMTAAGARTTLPADTHSFIPGLPTANSAAIQARIIAAQGLPSQKRQTTDEATFREGVTARGRREVPEVFAFNLRAAALEEAVPVDQHVALWEDFFKNEAIDPMDDELRAGDKTMSRVTLGEAYAYFPDKRAALAKRLQAWEKKFPPKKPAASAPKTQVEASAAAAKEAKEKVRNEAEEARKRQEAEERLRKLQGG